MQPSERGRCVLAERIFLGVQNTRHFSVTTKRKMPGRSHRESRPQNESRGQRHRERAKHARAPPARPGHTQVWSPNTSSCAWGEEACGTPAASPLPPTRGCSLHPGRRPSVHPSLQWAVGPGQGSRGPAACPPRPTADKDLPPPSGRHIHATASLNRSPNSPRRRQRPGQCGPSSCKKKKGGEKHPQTKPKLKHAGATLVRVQIRRDWGTGLGSRALACPHGLQDPRVYGAHMQIKPPKGGGRCQALNSDVKGQRATASF